MKKRIIGILLTAFMLIGIIPFSAIPALAETEVRESTLESSTGGQTIGERDVIYYYYVKSDTSCTATEPKVSGLSIVDGAEVHIVLENGATLTCTGGDASGFMGGGAGIEVPQYATLYLEGEGTVIATGGNAANGNNGYRGDPGSIKHDTTFYVFDTSTYSGGNGGAGGSGGAGAGAGIGTIGSGGGRGGYGGHGDGGSIDEDHVNVAAGEKGADAQPIIPMGTLRTSPTVKLTATGGAVGKPGICPYPYGIKCQQIDNYYTAVCGCSGGGGQGGGAGASIGTGGQGGGGGAGGNGGPAFYSAGNDYYAAKLYSGYGGGNTDGNYVEGANMGQGGKEFVFCHSNSPVIFWDGYPYCERNFGGAGGTDGVEHTHIFDEDGCCIVCAASEFVIDENGVLLKYNGFGGEIVIPEGVTRIANNVFAGNTAVTGIVLPSTLKEIGSSAFNGSGLTSISFPSSIKTIGHNAFQNCASLTSVTFPEEGEITILNSTFQGTPLTNIDIPVSVKAIGYNAFLNCTNLQNVTVHWTEADEIVTPQGSAFTGISSDCVLSVPSNTAQLYKNNTVWSKFSLINDTMLYMAYDTELKTFVQQASPVAPTELTSSDDAVTLPGGWYVAGDATIGGSLMFEGDAFIILESGSTLTVDGGIIAGGDLTFYAQTTTLDDMGGVHVPGTAGDGIPGINCSGKALNIHGGKIEVYGGRYAAGISGVERADGGNVTVYGGFVKAQSKADGAGIGGGNGGAGGKFTIYGGKVVANGSNSSGIGGGRTGAGGEIVINGGEVETNGNIGGGYEHGSSGVTTKVTINDGKITVSGDYSVIGGSNSTVEINGGEIKTVYGAIGVGNGGSNAVVTIRGGIIDAWNYYYPAIGGSDDEVYVNIYGGNIKAKSSSKDAIVAKEVNICPDDEKCEQFTVKDFSDNELTDSPITEETDITDILSENKQIKIDLNYAHTFNGAYVINEDGTHSRKCSVCGVLNDAESHNFVNHSCVCGATNKHDFKGDYVDNGDGTHSRNCTGCDELGETENHSFENHICVCGATNKHSFTGDYVDNKNGTHSRKCTECDELGEPENHVYVNGVCVCGKIEITNKYIDRIWDDTEKKVVSSEKDIPATVIEIGENTTELGGGWYYFTENVEIAERIVVKGTADDPTNIVLPDGLTLKAKSGIEVAEGSVLNIYGQKNDTGTIDAQTDNYNAAIGGNIDDNCGTVTVFGGTVIAASELGAGIGGGAGNDYIGIGSDERDDYIVIGGDGGTVTVNGGVVVATSEASAGIGGGIGHIGGNGGEVTINGGIVTATSIVGAGIGGGIGHMTGGDGSQLTVNDGTVNAKSTYGAGIGGGEGNEIGGNGGEVIINGGKVTATSFTGAGIGGGDGSESDDCIAGGNGGIVTVNGGTVDAESMDGAGIGGGSSGKVGGVGGTVIVNGGIVTAISDAGAGIGGGFGYKVGGDGGIVTVKGGTVIADSGFGAGIGGGTGEFNGGDGGEVTIEGGTVTATSDYGAGIGGGGGEDAGGAGGTLTVNGGSVIGISEYAAGIGGGDSDDVGGDGGIITVNGGTVKAESKYSAGIGGGIGCESHGELTVADGLEIKAGDTAADQFVTVEEYIANRNQYVIIDRAASKIVVSLGASINPDTSSLRLGAKYNGNLLDKSEREAIKDVGIIFYPSHLLGDGILDLNNTNVVRKSATAIIEFVDGQAFADYDTFTFYVTIVGIPSHGLDTKIAFRPFIILGDGTIEYGEVMERCYNDVAAVKLK